MEQPTQVLDQEKNQLAQPTVNQPVINPNAGIGNRVVDFVSILFILHGANNIFLFGYSLIEIQRNPYSHSNIAFLLIPELIGGIFSIICAYLIVRKTSSAYSAVLLRCLGGIFSLGTLITLTSSIGTGGPLDLSFVNLLRIWPEFLFLATIILITVFYIKLPRLSESRRWETFIFIFNLLMIANWIWSFVTFFLFIPKFS
ncbi:MAG: hypothetical protein AAB531_05075 [Patescibacteria group bacterium]